MADFLIVLGSLTLMLLMSVGGGIVGNYITTRLIIR